LALIEVVDVSKVYQTDGGKVVPLQGANLKIAEGELVAIMGPSGSGKSTLLTIIGGLNPASEGKLLIDGLDVYALSAERRADFRHAYIGFVFQQLQLVSYLTAIENVMLPLAISKVSLIERQRAAQQALERVGLGDKANRLPSALSGGEQGRVAVARAIVNNPPVVLADEPTGSLDTNTGEQVMAMLRALADEGLAVVLVTHNEENVRYADRVIRVRDGRLVREETVSRSLAVPALV
jgi:putative ABC transport system ATP-binding protein